MTGQLAVMVGTNLHVSFSHPVSQDEFHDYAARLMDELLALEECDNSITDSTVSSDADERLFTVEIVVRTDDQFEASEKAFATLRAALHAAGAGTPGWPTVVRTEGRTGPLEDLMSA
ncbi:hypothetical protein [Nocardiopsis alba]|uniref:hypothetical protein n=1 Tax=Nocardiopsis alba TaxID=53437 RepID=UPI00037D356A|nr:hypothetical protein [Nocardiopsis alba]